MSDSLQIKRLLCFYSVPLNDTAKKNFLFSLKKKKNLSEVTWIVKLNPRWQLFRTPQTINFISFFEYVMIQFNPSFIWLRNLTKASKMDELRSIITWLKRLKLKISPYQSQSLCSICCVFVCDNWIMSINIKEKVYTKIFIVQYDSLHIQYESP